MPGRLASLTASSRRSPSAQDHLHRRNAKSFIDDYLEIPLRADKII
jgi:hypothetical protein